MEKFSKKTENSRNNSNSHFSFKDIDAGTHVPFHRFLFDLLQKKYIGPEEITVFLVILNHAYFTLGGSAQFDFSNSDIQEATGLKRKVVTRTLAKLVDSGLIETERAINGRATKITLKIEALKALNKKYRGQNGQGTVANSDRVSKNHGQNGQGTVAKMAEHLYMKVLKVSLSYENKFFEHSRRETFKADLMRLAEKGVDIDAVASFLETCNFERIGSFYEVIWSKRDSLNSIHEIRRKIRNENEAAERRRFHHGEASGLSEVKFRTPDSMTHKGKPETAFKWKTGGPEVFRTPKFSDLDDVISN